MAGDLSQSETSVTREPRGMTKHDKALYDAWLAGFECGWQEGKDDSWPLKWILRAEYWAWRERRKRER